MYKELLYMYFDMYMLADERSLWKIEKSINKTITTKTNAFYFYLIIIKGKITKISAIYLYIQFQELLPFPHCVINLLIQRGVDNK